MKSNYHGKTALITGASSGIGEQIALELFAAGCRSFVLIARDELRLGSLRDRLTRYDPRSDIMIVAQDLAATGAADAILAILDDRQVDILVCNAGAITSGRFLETDRDKIRRALRLEETHIIIFRELGERMAERGTGTVIVVSSMAGIAPVPQSALYGAGKSLLNSLTYAVGVEERLAKSGVLVMLARPGATNDTRFTSRNGLISLVYSLPFFAARAGTVAKRIVSDAGKGKRVSNPNPADWGLVVLERILPLRALAWVAMELLMDRSKQKPHASA